MAEILSYNHYRDMHNDVQLSAMFFGKNIQNIPFFSSTQTAVKEFDSYGLKVFTFTGKERDSETGFSYFGARYYDSDILTGWLSVDPMADKYPGLSPYAYCGWNPVKLVDPDGNSISEFDENGNYLRTTKDNWWHNTFVGRKGHIVDSDGNVTQSFRFADPENDVEDLKNGDITKLQFVKESDIISMLSKAGAFDKENKTVNNDITDRYDYILKEGVGGGKFDFSYTGIPNQYPDASIDPLNIPSTMLFLVDGVAHNHMNFGNFLFGAGGKSLGITLPELKFGAHYNSLFKSNTNGYGSQLDSKDDQYSIRMGVRHARINGYKDMFYQISIGH